MPGADGLCGMGKYGQPEITKEQKDVLEEHIGKFYETIWPNENKNLTFSIQSPILVDDNNITKRSLGEQLPAEKSFGLTLIT